jgi:hypothetical protein
LIPPPPGVVVVLIRLPFGVRLPDDLRDSVILGAWNLEDGAKFFSLGSVNVPLDA